MKKFIKINEDRVLLSSIKRYRPIEDNSIYIYYSVSRYRVDKELFKFESEKKRDMIINILDEIL